MDEKSVEEKELQRRLRNTRWQIAAAAIVLIVIGIFFSIAAWNDSKSMSGLGNYPLVSCFFAFIGGILLTIMTAPLIVAPFIIPYAIFSEAHAQQSHSDVVANIGFVVSFFIMFFIAKTINISAPVTLPLWLVAFFCFSVSLYAGILCSEYVKEMRSDPFDRTDPAAMVLYWLMTLILPSGTVVFLGIFIRIFTEQSLL
ncbi:hypothetical protein [Candidatus Uabimicrobium amorphum]|uniref:Transmembrane protein n=1 Tax=Uabimicrobium amorphum TaxID=2596890 RepID=A0A5S9IW69_UABAM|nr:hypothetical protein [Candidatus Uabimicrobium amorphum]BBM88200.1 hypothetical protein UABAM_06621 [Candidatus Uabimicrobium amorphum]